MKVYVDERDRHEVALSELQQVLGMVQQELGRNGRVVYEVRLDGVLYRSLEDVLVDAIGPSHVVELTSLPIVELLLRTRREAFGYSQRLLMGCEQACQHWEAYEARDAGAVWARVTRGIEWLMEVGDRIARLEGRQETWEAAAACLSDALRRLLPAVEAGEAAGCAGATRAYVLPTLSVLGKWFESGLQAEV